MADVERKKLGVTAQWVGDTIDEEYPDNRGLQGTRNDLLEEEPEWYKKLYAPPEYKAGDKVTIKVGECEIHGEMKTISGEEFFKVVNGSEGIVQNLEPGDEQIRTYKAGHTVRVKFVTPVAVRHAQYGSMLFSSGLFMPHELVPVEEQTEEQEDS